MAMTLSLSQVIGHEFRHRGIGHSNLERMQKS